MTIADLKSLFLKRLISLYEKNEILSFFNLLINYQLKLSKIDAFLWHDQIVTQNDLNYFLNAIDALEKEKPIQYIIGETEFCGLPIKVNSHVLIPRPETEELVYWILNDLKGLQSSPLNKKSNLKILDIGTGSGCIAIALAKNLPDCSVYAIDISSKALDVARNNVELNKVHVNFIKKDILNCSDLIDNHEFENFDIIVSNPPYVRESEKDSMHKNVLQYEPHLALFVKDNDPLLFYKRIIDFIMTTQSGKGKLYLEINQYFLLSK
jgi:release factor glutamine methyltransferase